MLRFFPFLPAARLWQKWSATKTIFVKACEAGVEVVVLLHYDALRHRSPNPHRVNSNFQ